MAQFNGSVENIENNKNKTTKINQNSTDTQYPSAKATFDFVSETLKTQGATAKSITLWQPNTEYRVGDICFAVLTDSETNLDETCICECLVSHTSSDNINNELGLWRKTHIFAYSAARDLMQDIFTDKYATNDRVKKVIRYWQSDFYYQVGDLCLYAFPTNSGDNENPVDALFLYECKQDHTSTDIYLDSSYWNRKEITVSGAIKDGLGRYIADTYATKDELTEAIGQALEGDY